MERTKDKKLKWKKIHGNSFTAYIDGKPKLIKHNQVFEAAEKEVPKAFRDQIICLDKAVEGPDTIPQNPPRIKFDVVQIEEGDDAGKYNVVDSKGEIQNDEPLSGKAAKKLVKELSK